VLVQVLMQQALGLVQVGIHVQQRVRRVHLAAPTGVERGEGNKPWHSNCITIQSVMGSMVMQAFCAGVSSQADWECTAIASAVPFIYIIF
jgi:hypothetical protein